MSKKISVIRGNTSNEYPLFNQGRNYIDAKFISWDSRDCVKYISVTSNYLKIKKVYFCSERDTLEIRGEKGATLQPHIEKLSKCYLNEEKVIIFDFTKDLEKADYSDRCLTGTELDIEPKTSKGNVIVGG